MRHSALGRQPLESWRTKSSRLVIGPLADDVHDMLGVIAHSRGNFIAAEGKEVVVIGGGFAGGSCARALKRLDPRITVS